jgi:RNA polymerase sigma factor (sigma-70 family)
VYTRQAAASSFRPKPQGEGSKPRLVCHRGMALTDPPNARSTPTNKPFRPAVVDFDRIWRGNLTEARHAIDMQTVFRDVYGGVSALQGDSKVQTVERISEESKPRVEELYAAHAQGAVRLAYLLVGDHQTAQDIAQEAFLRAFGRFADLRKPASFATYLKTTIVNLTRKHFKRRGLERLYIQRLRARPAPSVAPPNIEQRAVVTQALLKVPERQRAALVLHYYEDLSEYEVADLLGVSEQAARSLVARGRKALREQLGGMRP